MAKRFIDPETGIERQREQRPDGVGARCEIVVFRPENSPASFRGVEIYKCLAEDCRFDTQWQDQFDMHWYYKHELPAQQQRAIAEADQRARERAARMKDRPDIPILGRS